jgi:phosphatidylglycerophosphate synthase
MTSSRMAYKAYEIEEIVDIYFYRRVGYLLARLAGNAGLTPNAVSILAAVVGLAGGVLLYDAGTALGGVGLLVLHGALDSADGQLARMTGTTSEMGRVLDGVAGYLTHTAIYLAIGFGAVHRGEGWWFFGGVVLAGLCTALHAQLYEYHRTVYADIVLKGRVAPSIADQSRLGPKSGALARAAHAYEQVQQRIAGLHPRVERALAARSDVKGVLTQDRSAYRRSFYALVRGWNLLGDNVRRYAIGVLVLAGRIEWFVAFTILPMTLVALVLWVLQRRADRAFLDALALEMDEPAGWRPRAT